MFKFGLSLLVLVAGTVMASDKSEESHAVQAFKMMQKHKTGMVSTINIKENPYVSIMVFQPDKDGNVFNGARVTLTGKLVVVTDEKSIEKLKKNYLSEHPDAKDFIDFGDFNFYLLELESIYFIGGFGEIGNVDIDEYRKIANK